MCQFSCIFVKLLYSDKCTALEIFVQYKLGLFPVYTVFERHCEEGLAKRVSTAHPEGEKIHCDNQRCDKCRGIQLLGIAHPVEGKLFQV